MLYSVLLQYSDEGGAGASLLSSLCSLALAVVVIVALWRVFQKAGKEGWAAIIPIYNYIVLLDIVGKPGWWVILLFIPFVNLIISIIIALELARSFGKGVGFGIGLILLAPIFFLILAFGDAEYIGPGGVAATPAV